VEGVRWGAYVLSRALALNEMKASDVKVVPLESNEQPGAFREGPGGRRRHLRSVSRPAAAAGAKALFDSTQIPGEIVDLVAVRAIGSRRAPWP